MPLISKVGRKRPRARFAIGVLYVLLCIGAVTMVYPFLLMVSTGMKGPTDQNDNLIVPAYLSDETELFRKFEDDKFGGNVEKLALIYGADEALKVISTSKPESFVSIEQLSDDEYERLEKFIGELKPHEWEAGFRGAMGRWGSKLATLYQDFLMSRYKSIRDLNAAYLEQHVFFQTVVPPLERFGVKLWQPKLGRKWDDWMEFRQSLPVHFRIPITIELLFQGYLRSKYKNKFDAVPAELRAGRKDFTEVKPDPSSAEFQRFFAESLPEKLKTDSPDARWHALTGDSHLALARYERTVVARNASALRREYAGRNYTQVLDYVLLHGSAISNTVIFCILAVLTQLIVNPLAAYALSRYQLRSTSGILLFLLATMAFPAEVTMIPGFLLLRDLGLLNTFAALVLPAAASGYSIYLLKGFFDSLPRDLFESGSIDGAREFTMFRRIAIPLSLPVLAVTALGAFVGAYGAFMYAFVVAQDQRMWTLMVWIYQLQTRAPKSTTMAALTVAALPTFLVFLFAQRVILRGIILPGEK